MSPLITRAENPACLRSAGIWSLTQCMAKKDKLLLIKTRSWQRPWSTMRTGPGGLKVCGLSSFWLPNSKAPVVLQDSLSLQTFLHFWGFFFLWVWSRGWWVMLMSAGGSAENPELNLKWICVLQNTVISDPGQDGESFLQWTISNQTGSALLLRGFLCLDAFQDTKMILSDLKCRWGFQRDLLRSDSSYCWFPSRAKHCSGCYKELCHNLAPLKKQKQKKILEFFPSIFGDLPAVLGKNKLRKWLNSDTVSRQRGFYKASLS